MIEDSRTEGQVGRHGSAVVNGPEDDVNDWHQVDWAAVEHEVRRLRQRRKAALAMAYKLCATFIDGKLQERSTTETTETGHVAA
jgi:hypothetical protein